MATTDIVKQIKSAINLKEYIEKYAGVEFTQINDCTWMARCPHPDHNDTTPSFRLFYDANIKQYNWSCMGCHCGKKDLTHKNYGSDIFAFVQWMSDTSTSKKVKTFNDVLRELAALAHVPLQKTKYSETFKLLGKQAKAYHANLSTSNLEYLYSRGVTDQSIKDFLIGSTYFKDIDKKEYIERIIFPLFDRQQRVIGFNRRALPKYENKVPKYIHSKSSAIFNKQIYLYGIHMLDRRCNTAIISEGPFDVILGHQYGLPNVMAVQGAAFSRDHAKLLQELQLTPIFCFDSDKAGLRATDRAVAICQNMNLSCYVIILPNAQDLADFCNIHKEKVKQVITRYTMPYWKYKIQNSITAYDSMIIMAKEEVYPELANTLSLLSKQEQEHMKNYVKERTGIELHV